MNLNKMVMDSLTKLESEGKVQEIVEKHVSSTVESIVKDAFGSWSDFSKNLKVQVESQLAINLKELNFTTYNATILSAVKEKLNDQIAAEGVARINESLEELLSVTKDEYKLSELVKELADEVDTDDIGYDDYHEMSMHIDDSFSLAKIIYLDSESGKDKYDCKYGFWVEKETGKIKNIEIKEGRFSTKRDVREFDARAIMRGFRGLEETLFKMYARGAKLIVDEDDVELEISNPDYD
ncbi:hypothetical protein OR571_13355 [Psychrobacillus sp. NEAU-3TGS]|uniref:hypothetical protein n=1 Tax=Psychrobacillus sp. NEAU-3TGS TaxID=2995412 RepID=UPI0024982C8D|nr:hypothetical protein [Psychrobacillus sp. NEAU-3TGS]MDI2588075.1 hypothetical protein [Psychrobacillus sp. NEAU-3TGS]